MGNISSCIEMYTLMLKMSIFHHVIDTVFGGGGMIICISLIVQASDFKNF